MSFLYTSPDDARSDLFLSAGVYLVGPLVLEILFQYIPLLTVPVLGPVLQVVTALATTALVPYLLMRYRRESFRQYGIAADRGGALAVGALTILPLAAASLLVNLLLVDSPLLAAPVLAVGSNPLRLVVGLVQWLGMAFLAAYATVKARDAFRSDPRTIRAGVYEIGRVIAIAVAVAALLTVIGGTLDILTAVVLPLGALGAVALALSRVRGPSSATRAVLLTPTVILALRGFNFTFNGRQFFISLWLTGLLACVGLVIGIHQESRNTAMAALGVGLTMALLTNL